MEIQMHWYNICIDEIWNKNKQSISVCILQTADNYIKFTNIFCSISARGNV